MIIKLILREQKDGAKHHMIINKYSGNCTIHCNITDDNNINLVVLCDDMSPIKLIPENEKLYSFTIYNDDTRY